MQRTRLFPLLALAAFALALALQGCASARRAGTPLAVPPGGFELVLLHTNDTHTYIAGADASGRACFKEDGCYGGYARISQAIKDEKAKGGSVLALDAGDQMQGTIFFATGKAPLIASLRTDSRETTNRYPRLAEKMTMAKSTIQRLSRLLRERLIMPGRRLESFFIGSNLLG